ncbi:alginate lyase family protein [Butyrivibrio sp. XPD2006]|uniref:alginate lyase family protein n=1 Tax=Butyrivibrio sp. XPD2006 TaxID=1280668 RepID=UPI0003B6343C|nr:alginate lyase family protein [Butyrivibrio sp. XPD2006]
MRILRFISTIGFLKPIQIIYQLRYRVLGYKRIDKTDCSWILSNRTILLSDLDENPDYLRRFKPEMILENRIELLNREVRWKPGVWNYESESHLWNFTLHYFEFGISLAYMFRETKDELYIKKLLELYGDWHNTALKDSKDIWHPYTVSLRLRNVLIIYCMLDSEWRERWSSLVLEDICLQYRFLKKNQEKNLLGNHYLENLITLYICSIFLEDKDREQYKNRLFSEIKEQILPDGMHFERSFMYHNLILEGLLRCYVISDEAAKCELSDVIRRMTDCIVGFETEKRIPHFNDAASNVAKSRDQLINAVKDTISYTATQIEHLSHSGYHRFESDGFVLLFDAGEIAPKYISGHSHCDTLSFELFLGDTPILVNSGTYGYQTEHRAYFRSTRAHNTIMADGVEQSDVWSEHRTARRATVEKVSLTDNAIRAEIRDFKGNYLSRKIEMGTTILVTDHSKSEFTSFWHIHPEVEVTMLNDSAILMHKSNAEIILEACGGQFKEVSKSCYYSEEIGKICSNRVFKSSAERIEIRRR